MGTFRKIIGLVMCLLLGGSLAAAEEASEQPASGGSELFVAYVYAAQRAAIWTDDLTAAANASNTAEVKGKFGLLSAEEVKAWTDRKLKAREQLKLMNQQRDEAYARLTNGYPWSGGAAPLVQTAAVQADSKLDAALRQALLDEKSAKSQAESADWMLRTGMIDALQAVTPKEAYRQARLATADAKQAYLQSIVAQYSKANGSPMRAATLLAVLKQGSFAELADEWMNALSTFMTPVLSNTATSCLTRNGVIYVPLRPYASALGYPIIADKATGQIRFNGTSDSFVVDPKQPRLLKNGQEYPLISQLYIQNNTTYVPLSFFLETFGVEAVWREADQKVLKISPIIGKDGSP
ncbi:copper amine oxidase N-terminal domain-containing protein [Cohnella sp. AR92]|uniref:copper amine oxidase N-terminal domain-containing protein n=1 Tax=Cohnella sp. AR92 TaxID=648716 RepID=UPI000F8ECAB6|nr:copper amine oxidase N-terminal domain-containing protein [Cohnella sp. AR92]RUS45892.1 copper amine oxidase N-terminal domain-containing protein [Cohnella sp. AR92]